MEGNQMKMREALLEIETMAGEAVENGTMELPQYSKIVDIAESALSAPPRQCDVGTDDEQADRYLRFCRASKPRVATCDGCPLANTNAALCEFTWSQMPYETQEGGAK